MGSLFSKKQKTKRVLLLGLDGAGKSTILQNMMTSPNQSQTYPTIGFNVERIQYDQSDYELWDIGGQSKLRSFWSNHFISTKVIAFVVDSNDVDRLAEAKTAFDGIIDDNRTCQISIILIANKQDLPHVSLRV
ncbi:hypothetical protein A3Q56_07488 [Intoshia linei]|uniref:Uncharacterized protein n=1 Tax=Intoshia linei TaxID=1819745 RepID=A0A177AS25_9BILA|nr:hypothetical protein A3Q56_07488 [Intoshia linei]